MKSNLYPGNPVNPVFVFCILGAQLRQQRNAPQQQAKQEGTDFHFDCQQILYAIGQSPLLELLSSVRGVELSNGRVKVERATGLTSNPKYFAGGDCVNGGREVVDAVADGKRAGVAMAAVQESSPQGLKPH